MKKYTRVLFLVALSVSLGALAGCSSAGISNEGTDAPVEAGAGGEQFDSLANADLTPSADPGAIVDSGAPSTSSSEPSTTLAAADTSSYAANSYADNSPAYSAPKSPVNLGASSAGRAH